MKKKLVLMVMVMAIAGTFATGCSDKKVEQEAEQIETEVKGDAGEFISKVEADVKKVEETAKADVEKGEKDIPTVEAEAKAGFDKIKEGIEKDAGEAKEAALKLVEESEAKLNELFN